MIQAASIRGENKNGCRYRADSRSIHFLAKILSVSATAMATAAMAAATVEAAATTAMAAATSVEATAATSVEATAATTAIAATSTTAVAAAPTSISASIPISAAISIAGTVAIPAASVPGTRSQEDAAVEPVRTVISIRCAGIWVVAVVAIGADRRRIITAVITGPSIIEPKRNLGMGIGSRNQQNPQQSDVT
jgi:hypothetical protein